MKPLADCCNAAEMVALQDCLHKKEKGQESE